MNADGGLDCILSDCGDSALGDEDFQIHRMELRKLAVYLRDSYAEKAADVLNKMTEQLKKGNPQ